MGEQREHRQWVLNPRATNNMIGARSAFSELHSGIRESVKFDDGSIVCIKGHGTILFVGKGSKHCKLTNVNFIPRLKANLVSIDQLDEVGCYIYIERRLFKIWDDRQRLLTQVRRTANCLCIMELKIK